MGETFSMMIALETSTNVKGIYWMMKPFTLTKFGSMFHSLDSSKAVSFWLWFC